MILKSPPVPPEPRTVPPGMSVLTCPAPTSLLSVSLCFSFLNGGLNARSNSFNAAFGATSDRKTHGRSMLCPVGRLVGSMSCVGWPVCVSVLCRVFPFVGMVCQFDWSVLCVRLQLVGSVFCSVVVIGQSRGGGHMRGEWRGGEKKGSERRIPRGAARSGHNPSPTCCHGAGQGYSPDPA